MQQQRLGADEQAKLMRERCLGSRVSQLHRQIGRRFDQALAPLGVTMAQLELLAALESVGEPVAPSLLGTVLSLERSTISRNLALLESRGLAEVAERTPSGRARAVTITDPGRARLAESHGAWATAQAEAEAALGESSAAEIDGWLTRLGSGWTAQAVS